MEKLLSLIAILSSLVSFAVPAFGQGIGIGVQGSVPRCTHTALNAGTCQTEIGGYRATLTDGLTADPDRCAPAGTGGSTDEVACIYNGVSGAWEEFNTGGGGGSDGAGPLDDFTTTSNCAANSVTITAATSGLFHIPSTSGCVAGDTVVIPDIGALNTSAAITQTIVNDSGFELVVDASANTVENESDSTSINPGATFSVVQTGASEVHLIGTGRGTDFPIYNQFFEGSVEYNIAAYSDQVCLILNRDNITQNLPCNRELVQVSWSRDVFITEFSIVGKDDNGTGPSQDGPDGCAFQLMTGQTGFVTMPGGELIAPTSNLAILFGQVFAVQPNYLLPAGTPVAIAVKDGPFCANGTGCACANAWADSQLQIWGVFM